MQRKLHSKADFVYYKKEKNVDYLSPKASTLCNILQFSAGYSSQPTYQPNQA